MQDANSVITRVVANSFLNKTVIMFFSFVSANGIIYCLTLLLCVELQYLSVVFTPKHVRIAMNGLCALFTSFPCRGAVGIIGIKSGQHFIKVEYDVLH